MCTISIALVIRLSLLQILACSGVQSAPIPRSASQAEQSEWTTGTILTLIFGIISNALGMWQGCKDTEWMKRWTGRGATRIVGGMHVVLLRHCGYCGTLTETQRVLQGA